MPMPNAIRERIECEGDSDFPLHLLSGAAGNFATTMSRFTESPEQFYFFSYLTILGNLLADRVSIRSEIKPQPRMYTVLLGASADDRKSTAINKTTAFFRDNLISADKFGICLGIGSAEGLQKRIEKHPKLVLVFDELRAFVSKCRIDASVLLPCVTTLFENNQYQSRTKTSNVDLSGIYLSILAASTSQTYQNTWTPQFLDIGFNNRLFLVTGRGERKFSIPPEIPTAERNQMRYALQSVLQKADEIRVYDVDNDAGELFQTWYLNLPRSIHVKRLDTYALRFLPLLAVNDLKDTIDAETVKKAIAISNWQLQVRIEHDPVDADNQLAITEEKIRRVLLRRGPSSLRELWQHANQKRVGHWIFNTALSNLRQAGEISMEKGSRKFILI